MTSLLSAVKKKKKKVVRSEKKTIHCVTRIAVNQRKKMYALKNYRHKILMASQQNV